MARLLAGAMVERTDVAFNAGSTVTVLLASSTLIAAANKDRVALILTNDGANKIYVRLAGTGATAGQGIPLQANGGVVVIDNYTGAVSGRAVVGDTALSVAEI